MRSNRTSSSVASLAAGALLLLALAAAPGRAVNYLGDRANNCVGVGAGNTHVLTLNNGVSAGATILVSGFISANGAEAATPVLDSHANSWTKAHSYVATNGGRLFVFETRVATGKALSGGDTITLAYSGASGQTSCAVASVFDGLKAASSADVKKGGSGSSKDPTVTGSSATAQANELLLGGFGFIAATGGFSYDAPLQTLSAACSSPYCFFPGYRLLSSTITPSADATTVNVTSWGAIVVTFKGDNTIFADGFENSTTSNWSATVG